MCRTLVNRVLILPNVMLLALGLNAVKITVGSVVFTTIGFSSSLFLLVGIFFLWKGGVARDRHRQDIENREAEFRFMADSLPQLIWTTTPDGKITYFNQKVEDFDGPETEQILDWWRPRIHPEDRDQAISSLTTSMREGLPLNMEHRITSHSKGCCWLLTTATPHRDENGHIVRWYGSSTDISLVKRVEQNLQEETRLRRLMVESVKNYGIFALDPQGNITLWSPGAQEALGYTSEDVMGRHYEMMFPLGLKSLAKAHLIRAAGDGKYETSGPRLRKGGGLIEVSSTVSAMYHEGEVIGFVKVIEDITAIRAHEKELQVAKEHAESASRAKDQFLAVVSHELRTPLTPVIMMLSHVVEAELPAGVELREMLTMFKSNLELEARLIDDLLDVMRILRGKLPYRFGVVEAHDLIQLVLEIVRGDTVDAELKVELTLEAVNTHINADPARIQQVLWNLIKNAAKFCPGGLLKIRSFNQDDKLILEFEDNGIGITEEQMSRIFNVFEQGDNSLVRRYGGLGLGLAIGRSVVEAHKGLLLASSEGSGQGATFRLELPLMSPPDSKEGSESLPLLKSLRILLVEDDVMTNKVLSKLMAQHGFVVDSSKSVGEAIDKCRTETPYDVIVSDIGLPDGTGHQIMEHIRTINKTLPAIALTGYGMENDIERAKAAGFQAHLTKPVDLLKLIETIRSLHDACQKIQ